MVIGFNIRILAMFITRNNFCEIGR
jgi:hypothetical protein